jgi:hypothetical protein
MILLFRPESAAMSAQRERSRSAITPAEGIARMAQKQQHEPRSPQQSEPANLRIATQKGDKLDKKQRLAPEQRRYLNENPGNYKKGFCTQFNWCVLTVKLSLWTPMVIPWAIILRRL